jgi:hypothetical protein
MPTAVATARAHSAISTAPADEPGGAFSYVHLTSLISRISILGISWIQIPLADDSFDKQNYGTKSNHLGVETRK